MNLLQVFLFSQHDLFFLERDGLSIHHYLVLTSHCLSKAQGNLLKGIDNKTVAI